MLLSSYGHFNTGAATPPVQGSVLSDPTSLINQGTSADVGYASLNNESGSMPSSGLPPRR